MERSASILIIKINWFTSRGTLLFPNNKLCFMVGRGVVLCAVQTNIIQEDSKVRIHPVTSLMDI